MPVVKQLFEPKQERIVYCKYPRTPHLPFSFSKADDDKTLDSDAHFYDMPEVVVTIKMDGENTTVYPNGRCHARSLDSKHRDYHSWLLQDIQNWCYSIPTGFHVCGEYLYAKHSIEYTALKSYFYGFSVWDGFQCIDWDHTMEIFNWLGICSVPVVYRGKYDAKTIRDVAESVIASGNEGVVVRNMDAFLYGDFGWNVGKCVRPNHVQTTQHWLQSVIIKNLLETN